MPKTAFTAKHVILRIPVRILTGLCLRGEGVRLTTDCDSGMQILPLRDEWFKLSLFLKISFSKLAAKSTSN